jgi:ABC-2 type transport system ATP-binding protein
MGTWLYGVAMLEVSQLCDFVVIMSRGRVVAKGSLNQLVERFECENLDEVFVYLARVA